jgi:ABC-type branched-subunit amino acid transport system substrate-binding protein
VSAVLSDFNFRNLVADEKAVTVSNGDINFGFMTTNHMSSDRKCKCDIAIPIGCAAGLESLKFALNSLNRRSDLLPNISVGYVAVDDCASALRALEVSVVFINDILQTGQVGNCSPPYHSRDLRYDVVGIIGPAGSAAASLQSSFVGAFNIPLIGTYATSDTLSDKNIYGYFLRMVSPDSYQVKAMLDLCQFLGWSYISLVYSESTYGENGATKLDQFLRDSSNNYSLCLSTVQKIYADATDEDYSRVVHELVSFTHMKVVLLFMDGTFPYPFFAAVRQIAGADRFVWLTGDFLNFYFTSSYQDVITDAIYFDHPSVVMPEFYSYVRAINPFGNIWLADSLGLKNQCDDVNQQNWTEECKQQAVAALDQCPFFWPLINRVYDAVYVLADAVHRLLTDVCPNAFEQKWMLNSCIRGETLLRYLQNTSLEGLNGRIKFDNNGNIQENLTINQFQLTSSGYSSVVVGYWNPSDRRVLLDINKLSWNSPNVSRAITSTRVPIVSVCSLPCEDNEYVVSSDVHCCWTCRSCRDNEIVSTNRTSCEACPDFYWPNENATSCVQIDPTYLRISHPISACLLVLAALCILSTVIVANVYLARRRSKLVMATNLPLSMITLMGVVAASIAVAIFVIPPSSSDICIARSFGFHCSINLVYTPLFVKNVIIYRIFSSGAPKISFKSTKFQMFLMISSFILQVCSLFVVR